MVMTVADQMAEGMGKKPKKIAVCLVCVIVVVMLVLSCASPPAAAGNGWV